jgi:NADH:ubiquinone oxidoreductase subunit 5 (subunit L)/multisubunit Na+/H+ antiporter MnhA subunit
MLYPSPLISSVLFLASISLCGAPFRAAFFSKEPIVEILSVSQNSLGGLTCLILSIFLTILYSSRLIKIVTLQFNSLLPNIFLNESDYLLNKGIFVLYIPSFISGLLRFSFSIRVPHRFYYPEVEKVIIISLLFIIFYILIKKCFIVVLVGSYYIFTM